jgi:transposase-like protein
MVTARKKPPKEKDSIDRPLDNIDFRGLTRDEAAGQDGLIKQLTGRILLRALEAGMTERLGYEKNSNAGDGSGNSRNGRAEKTVPLENRSAAAEVPRGRNGTFEPAAAPKREKRIPLFNGRVISLYAGGMTDRKIQEHIERMYHVNLPPDMISGITDAVIDEERERQNRLLEKTNAVWYPDEVRIKARHGGKSRSRSVYEALGVNVEGRKEVDFTPFGRHR